MAYRCPRCGGPVQRGHSMGAQMAAGLIGALFYAAFGSFNCPKCGKISQGEFPPEDRSKMNIHSAIMVVVAVAIAIAVIAVIVAVNT